MKTFPHVFQPSFEEYFNTDYKLKGKWQEFFFKNQNPIILELGCGKGEYTVKLAQQFLNINFIGVDIKGARMWKGAKIALTEKMKNVAFLRTKIESIASFFAENEVSEIWLTFPDPQIKKLTKRLSSAFFLNQYQSFLQAEGCVHLKTDSELMFGFTKKLIRKNKLDIVLQTENLYAEYENHPILSIKTYYEAQYLARGLKIKYLKFRLNTNNKIENPEEDKNLQQKEIESRKKTGSSQILRGNDTVIMDF